MKKINIVVNYKGIEEEYNNWSNEEDFIDWAHDHYKATRCTVSYAATELKAYLSRVLNDAEITYSSVAKNDFYNIFLIAETEEGKEDEYTLKPVSNGLEIIGKTRVGVLFGSYELLRMQGIRWFTPQIEGDYVPPKTDNFVLPTKEMHFKAKMDLGRGFDFEGYLPGNSMYRWMSRNNLNVARPQEGCEAFQNKVGIIFKSGGHFFHWMLMPSAILPDGKTVWESKRDWYGKREDGAEITKENALKTQFCVSNDECCEYISEEIIKKLNVGEWRYAERLDIWGFDTWGDTCCCDACKKIGNSSDRTLHFLSILRKKIDEANLGRKVTLVTCSYGGTCTLEPPENDIPQNIIDAGDLMVFYPITRCYQHKFDDPSCQENAYMYSCVKGWLDKKPAMPVVMGEYYDCSKFEEIPAVLMDTMCYDIKKYCEMGIRGITYMHVPVSDWGQKCITQHIYSRLSYDPALDSEEVINDYFEKRYTENAKEMRKVYEDLQTALVDIQFWRSWSPESVLSQFQVWNGGVPTRPLIFENHYKNHFDTHAEIIKQGRLTVELMEKSKATIEKLMEKYFDCLEDVAEIPLAQNPSELGIYNKTSKEEFILGEDLRLLTYGTDSMKLLTYTVEYYDALYQGKETADIWSKIVEVYKKLSSYFTCISNGYEYFGGMCPSGIRRTQMQAVIRRCASYRKNHNMTK